jgi:hypothetical protein
VPLEERFDCRRNLFAAVNVNLYRTIGSLTNDGFFAISGIVQL